MATLSVESITESGLNATYSAADVAGDTFSNDTSEEIFLHVKNGDASPHTVTVTAIVASRVIPGLGTVTKADSSTAIPAGEDRFIGPFPFTAYGSSPDITYDDVTSVTVAVLRV